MAERVVIEVEVRDEKRITKAKIIAAECRGVSMMSIKVEGQKAQLVVTGQGIDSYKLVQKLKKKVARNAKIVNPTGVEAIGGEESIESLGARLISTLVGRFSRGGARNRG